MARLKTVGTLASRPPSPTAGDEHTATDIDQFFRCFADGAWTPAGSGIVTARLIKGVKLVYVSASSVEVGEAGINNAISSSDDTSILTYTGALTGNMPADLDTGAEASNTLYAVYLTWQDTDLTNRAVRFSTNFTTPTFSGGRNKAARVGAVFNDGASNFTIFRQVGFGTNRKMIYDNSILNRNVLTAGNSGGAFLPVSLAPYVPTTAVECDLQFNFVNVAAGNTFFIRRTGSTNTVPYINLRCGFVTAGGGFAHYLNSPLETNSIDYQTSATVGVALDLWLGAYEDRLK